MKKPINIENWEKIFCDYAIVDCAIREKNIIYIQAVSSTDKPGMRQVTLVDLDNDETLAYSSIQFPSAFTSVLGTSTSPISQGLLIDCLGGFALPSGGGKTSWDSETVARDTVAVIQKIKRIDGYAWAVGLRRFVSKRFNIGDWRPVMNGISSGVAAANGSAFDYGFNDIAGFTENDIYAVGGQGDIWHFDGHVWQQCGFPTNDKLTNVVCADDGFVYVASRKRIWRGKLNKWESVDIPELKGELNDLCWFNHALWGIGQHDFFSWASGTINDYFICNGEQIRPSGTMDCNDALLIIASYTNVWSFDGSEWYNTVPNYKNL